MPVALRPVTDADLPGLVALQNAVLPDYPRTIEEIRHSIDAWDHTRFFLRRFVAEDETGQIVGRGRVSHLPDQFHPDRYEMDLTVHPDHRRRGIGSALYDRLLAEMRERGAIALRGEVREEMPEAVAFVRHRDFVEIERTWESRLDVTSFDPVPFAGADERLTAAGVRITTLEAERDRAPHALRDVYDLQVACDRDVPSVHPITAVPFEQFIAHEVEGPTALPDGYFLAVTGEGDETRYVGMSSLFASAGTPEVLNQGLTGVLPPYRGRGVAMALKLQTVCYAQDQGKREIRTWNDTTNQPMLRINEAMGFARQPVWIGVEKTLDHP